MSNLRWGNQGCGFTGHQLLCGNCRDKHPLPASKSSVGQPRDRPSWGPSAAPQALWLLFPSTAPSVSHSPAVIPCPQVTKIAAYGQELPLPSPPEWPTCRHTLFNTCTPLWSCKQALFARLYLPCCIMAPALFYVYVAWYSRCRAFIIYHAQVLQFLNPSDSLCWLKR